MLFVKRASKAVKVFYEAPIDKWRRDNSSVSLLRLSKWAKGRGFKPEGVPTSFGEVAWSEGGDMRWLRKDASHAVWGGLVREALRWGRRTQHKILGEAKTISYRDYARKWKANFWKGRKAIYRAAKEGPSKRVVMNTIRSERTGNIVTKPSEVRDEVFRGFSTEPPYKLSVPDGKREVTSPLTM
jgi:hypothetical protein